MIGSVNEYVFLIETLSFVCQLQALSLVHSFEALSFVHSGIDYEYVVNT